MLNSSDVRVNSLHDQHTLQGQDLLEICAIASQETHIHDIYSYIETWKFEQFFGLVCHLFITTESSASRQQLANLLPKFGSIAVFSLLKIIENFRESTSPESEIKNLALNSLKQIELHPLVTGITEILEDQSTSDATIESLLPVLITLAARHQNTLFLELSKQLSSDTWNTLQTSLLSLLSDLRKAERFEHRERHITIHLKNSDTEKQLVEVA